MADIGETCNHAAAAVYHVEAADGVGLTNPTCTSNANKWLITASKTHELVTKMIKEEKCSGGTVNMWSFNEKVSRLVFVKPNIPAPKYGRYMEIETTNTFIELSDCWLFVDETLPYVGVSSERILLCLCCEKACVEIKCPYSINYTKPCNSSLEYLRLCDGKTVLKKSHKYYTQCMLQMTVDGTIKNYFVVWTPHGMIIDETYFDHEFWFSMKNKFEKYYEHFL